MLDDDIASDVSLGGISIDTPVGPFPSVAWEVSAFDSGREDDIGSGISIENCLLTLSSEESFWNSNMASTNFAAWAGMTAIPIKIDPQTTSLPLNVIGTMSPNPTVVGFN